MSYDHDMKEALQTFTIESIELLQDMEDNLLNIEDSTDPGERINSIFRAAHTIKGSAGLFGLDHIVRFTHVVESVLDALRDGKLAISTELVAILLPCCDHISLLVGNVANDILTENPDITADGDLLIDMLKPFLNTQQKQPATEFIHQQAHVESIGGGGVMESGNWHISLRFGIDSLRNGMDPLSFIRYLSTMGEVVHISTISSGIPEIENMDPENNYLGFEINLKSDANKETLENVFEFVRDESLIFILPMESSIEKYIELIHNLPENDQFLGELLVNSGVVTKRELEEGLNKQKSVQENSQPSQPIGEILIEQRAVQQPIVNAALEKQKHIKESKNLENQSIRVDAERLDKLIDLIGELVISSAGVNLQALQTTQSALLEATGEMMRLVEEVRDSALQLRMVPIGTTFSRFQRVVRDVSKELGKNINLVITGGDTEVDKSVVEKISDPLMHLVRNAMDHGIENAAADRHIVERGAGQHRQRAGTADGAVLDEAADRDRIRGNGR